MCETRKLVEQRYQIEVLLRAGKNQKEIADLLNKSKSVICREIKRNSTKRGKYNAKYAQNLVNERKERFVSCRKQSPYMRKIIEQYLQKHWSPKQIVGFCRKNNIAMLSHETIYKIIRKDKAQGGNLYMYTRHKLKHWKRTSAKENGKILDRISIEHRPDIVNNRERFGDWEMDTIIGANHRDAIVTLVERTTGFIMMIPLDNGKNAQGLAKSVINMLLPYKEHVHTITVDNGTEFTAHKSIAQKLQADIFFTHPYSSWEKGRIEYSNKLIREFIPKKTDFKTINQMTMRNIQCQINDIPRKNLNFNRPKNLFLLILFKRVHSLVESTA